jgi:hypothetical protein
MHEHAAPLLRLQTCPVLLQLQLIACLGEIAQDAEIKKASEF